MLGKNFLKGEPARHRDPVVRLEHVRGLDPERDHESLATLAREDESGEVRRAAIGRLLDVRMLCELAQADRDGGERLAAEARLAEGLEQDLLAIDALLGQIESGPVGFVRSVATHSVHAECRDRALERLGDEADLLVVVEQTRFHDTRLAAASRLEDEALLRQALVACRLRDKVVARQIQSRLDALNEARASVAADEAAIEHTRAALEELAASVWSPQHRGRLQALMQRWAGLPDTLTAPHAASVEQAASRVRDAITEAEARHAASETADPGSEATRTDTGDGDAEAATPPAADEAGAASGESVDGETTSANDTVAAPTVDADASLDPLREALAVDALEQLDAAVSATRAHPDGETTPAKEAVLAHAGATAVLFDPPFDVARGRPQAIEERLKRVTALLDTATCLTGIDVQGFRHLDLLAAHHEALTQRLGKASQESADRIKATQHQFAALAELVREGKWAPASSMLRRLQRKIERMESRERSQVADRLAKAEQQLGEMADWQDFAARPKLEALCVEMEALAATDAEALAATARANEVKRLQGEWKALGPSRAANELWTRFKAAADEAFAPAKAHFESRREEREAKRAAREAVCEAVEAAAAAMDWSAPDWKVVQRQVAGFKRDWSRNRVPDRKPDKALEARFSAALEPFETRLSAQYDANAAEQRDLVERAEKLAAEEISQHVVNQARRLQASWKQIGITRRREDQALWEAFNGACREIFRKHQGAERERQRAELGHVYRAREIIREMRRLAEDDTPDEARIQALAAEFESLPAFPDRDRKGLQRDFRGVSAAMSKVQANRQRRRAVAEREELQRRTELVERLEEAIESPGAGTDTLVEEVRGAWDDGDARPSREALARLEARRDRALAHLEAGTNPDWDAGEEARRDLLVRLEVASGAETPEEDKARRMRYQLEMLQAGMGNAAVLDRRARLDALALDWLEAPAVRRTVRDRLDARFRHALGH